jgi:small subunit ribosomal protein S17
METRNLRKERIGVVTSNKMEKSIVVSEVKKVKHPMYGKFVLKTKKYVAHDEQNDCNVGDTVKIMETRPSKQIKMLENGRNNSKSEVRWYNKNLDLK